MVVVMMNTEYCTDAAAMDVATGFSLFHSGGFATHFIRYCCGERRLQSDLMVCRQFVSGVFSSSAKKLILA